MEAAGNDFIIVDTADTNIKPKKPEEKSGFAEKWCKRRFGVGGDGVIFLEKPEGPQDIAMSLFQPDGSTAAMSGNGLRCVTRYSAEKGYIDKKRNDEKKGKVKTDAGDREVSYIDGNARVEMGEVSFRPSEIPAKRKIIQEEIQGYTVTACNSGVLHAVIFLEDIEKIDIEKEAPPIRSSNIFPEGANVNFASKIDGGYKVRTFERGVEAETLSCGTGAIAVVAVARKLGFGKDKSKIKTHGGLLNVDIREDNSFLEGEVNKVYRGELSTSSTS